MDDRGCGLFCKGLDQLWGQPTLSFSGHRRLFLWLKQPEHEADHPTPSVEVKKVALPRFDVAPKM